MSHRWKSALAVAALATVAAWAFWPDGNELGKPSPHDTRGTVDNVVPRSSPKSSPKSSPFLTSHETTRSDTSADAASNAPSSQNVDRRFHSDVERLRESVREDSNSVDDMLKLARMSQDSHQLDDAVTLYRRILTIDPDRRDAWLDLSRCYGLQKNWSGALRTVDEMLNRFEEDLGALYNRGAILANMGNEADARQVWLKVAQQDDDERLKTMAAAALERLGEQ